MAFELSQTGVLCGGLHCSGAIMTIRLSALLCAAILCGGVISATALDGPGRTLVASGVLKLSADTQRSGFLIIKQFIVPYAGVVRLRYQFKSDGQGPQTVSVQVTGAIESNNTSNCS